MTKILVVEDNELTRRLLRDLLSSSGYEIFLAGNGREGVDMAGQHNPDLILMDIQMPVMSGLEATRLLRADARFRDTPILAVTAFADQYGSGQSDMGQFTETIGKPFTVLGIMNAVRRYCGIPA